MIGGGGDKKYRTSSVELRLGEGCYVTLNIMGWDKEELGGSTWFNALRVGKFGRKPAPSDSWLIKSSKLEEGESKWIVPISTAKGGRHPGKEEQNVIGKRL